MTVYKYYAQNLYYHVYSRGNQKQRIFGQEADYSRFVQKIKEYRKKYPVDILAYCLLPNHFHFLLYQPTKIPINKFMQALLVSHIRYFQKKYKLVGHLFQGRFQAKIVEAEPYLLQLSRYIHQNPLGIKENSSRRELFSNLKTYQWSSYLDYLGKRMGSFVSLDLILSFFSKTNPKLSYQSFVETEMNEDDIESLKDLVIEKNV